MIKVPIPENLDIDKLLSSYSYDFIRPFKKDHLVYIISLLNTIRSVENSEGKPIGKFPINSTILQSIVKNHNQYLTFLKAAKVFQSDNWHIKEANKSRYYWFTPKYRTICKFYEITDFTTKKNITTKLYKIPPGLKLKEYNHLSKWFKKKNNKLFLNSDLAKDFIKRDYLYKVHSSEVEGESSNKILFSYILQYKSEMYSIQKIQDCQFYFTIDTTSFRLHTPLTQIRIILRNCISYNSTQLISIDIKNCQPYLSIILFNPSFWDISINNNHSYYIKGSLTLNDISKKLYLKYTNKIKLLDIPSINLDETVESQSYTGFHAYLEFIQMDDPYSHFQDLMNYVSPHKKDYTRPDIKSEIIVVFYSKNKTYTFTKKVFRAAFPGVLKFLSLLKKEDHADLAILLQTIESHLILKVITKKIAKVNPNIPLYTIHDSIVTTKENEDIVKHIMHSELEKAIGIPPKLKVEDWLPSNLEFSTGEKFLQP